MNAMLTFRAHARCNRGIRGTRCRKRYDEHVDGRCPEGDSPEHTFHSSKSGSRPAASNSFTVEEVNMLGDMLAGVARRQDLTSLCKREAFTNLHRKVLSMKARIARLAQREGQR